MKATHTGVMNGIPPTGKTFELDNFVIHRFENGLIAESWVSWDNVAMLQQLGLFPPPATETP
jgi:predicted ester cyclase